MDAGRRDSMRSEEHTSELQSLRHLVCRLLPEKKKEIHNALFHGDRVAMEVLWQGRLASPAYDLAVGGEMRAHFAIFFFFNDRATPEIYTLSLHDALPI